MIHDPYLQGFAASFAVTGVALAATLALGRTRRLKAHVVAVVAFLLLFVVTIGFAEAVGRRYVFDARARSIHLPIAIAGALGALGPVVTGFRRWRGRGSLGAHRATIAAFLVVFVLATATGVWMLATGTAKGAESTSAQ